MTKDYKKLYEEEKAKYESEIQFALHFANKSRSKGMALSVVLEHVPQEKMEDLLAELYQLRWEKQFPEFKNDKGPTEQSKKTKRE